MHPYDQMLANDWERHVAEEEMTMYTITHHYLTVDDDGASVVEVETRTVDEPLDIGGVVDNMVAAPGGRSGTTITITVSLDGSTSI